MGRQRGFLPPAACQACGNRPHLGQTLMPGDVWRCLICLEATLPGKDATSKSMNQMAVYARGMDEAFKLQAEGSKADGPRNKAEWARFMAAEIRKQGMAKSTKVAQGNGEAVPPEAGKFLFDTLTVPDLAAVEASFERSRLLTEQGSDVAAMGIDAANTTQAGNSLGKMFAHELAALHKVNTEMIGSVVPHSRDAAIQTRRLNAAARGMAVYQQGLLTLRKLRLGGHQRISVQHVHVSGGGQAIVGDVVKN